MKYHSNTTGPDAQSFRTGFAKCIQIAISNGDNEVLILNHTLGNLQGLFYDVLGDDFVKQLSKTKEIRFRDVTIFLETERIRSPFRKGAIFAAHVSPDLLQKALLDSRATDVIYLPWTPEELNTYLSIHNNSTEL